MSPSHQIHVKPHAIQCRPSSNPTNCPFGLDRAKADRCVHRITEIIDITGSEWQSTRNRNRDVDFGTDVSCTTISSKRYGRITLLTKCQPHFGNDLAAQDAAVNLAISK